MIVVVPAWEAGRGGGHLVRCTKLVNELKELGKEAILYESSNYTNEHELNIGLIVLDRFQTPKEEFARWKQLAPVIGIDEGGICRAEFDFLIDILPNLEKVKPNISDIGLLPLPKKKPHAAACLRRQAQRHRVLISFGMEDSGGLGQAVFNSLSEIKDDKLETTFLNKENRIENLAGHLHEYDLVITHFGITAFEAMYAGTKVLLINPAKYHEKLAKKAGFRTTTIKKINKISALPRLRAGEFAIKPKSLAKLIASFSPHIYRACPVCEAAAPKHAIARFPDRTYHKCSECGIIFMDRLASAPVAYKKEYFFEEYQKQYGKTYLEDFPNLKQNAKRRLKIISHIGLPAQAGTAAQRKILDIGCAYGAFLSAAKEEGYDVQGIDPSHEAIKYVTENLGIQAAHSFFPVHCSLFNVHFDAITLWFTIEHFQNCIPVFKEIRFLLEPGGILAFSTPSFRGISGRKNLRKFLENSPADHYTIWSPSSCKKALAINGFKAVKIVNCGHHPERFPFLGKLACCKYSPVYWLLLAISQLFSLGDTFEIYAFKKEPAELARINTNYIHC